jgi:hypothetical protein
MRNSSGGPDHMQDWVQDETLLDVFGEVVGSSAVRIKSGVSTNVLSKSNHTHGGGGGYNRNQCTGQSKDKVRVHLRKTQLYAKVCLKTFFETSF